MAPPPSPQAKKPLLSVFDWDDTLCPTSWLHHRGLLVAHGLVDGAPSMDIETFEQTPAPTPMTPMDRHRLELLERQVLAILQLSAQFGPVFIVTAASLPWVVASAEHFLPKVRQFLLDNQRQCESGEGERVQVVSARDWYHHQVGAGGTQLTWKCATFEALCNHLKVHEVFHRLSRKTHLVSVGDARFEQIACVRVEVKNEFVRSKTMKFLEQPTLEELLEELKMAEKLLEELFRYDGGLHLRVERKAAGSEAWRANVVEGGECALETLRLVQIDRSTVLEGYDGCESDAKLQQLLAAADTLARRPPYPVRGAPESSSQNEQPLAAVPGLRS